MMVLFAAVHESAPEHSATDTDVLNLWSVLAVLRT
jgi:hypothetical protein